MLLRALVSASVAALLAAAARAAEDESGGVPPQSVELERSGATKLCLRWDDMKGYTPLSETRFLFETGDGYYVNDVMGECRGAMREDARIRIVLQGPSLCRNDTIDVETKRHPHISSRCTLSSFHELRPVSSPAEQ